MTFNPKDFVVRTYVTQDEVECGYSTLGCPLYAGTCSITAGDVIFDQCSCVSCPSHNNTMLA